MISDVEEVCGCVERCTRAWANDDGGLWCYGCSAVRDKEIEDGADDIEPNVFSV